MRSENVVFFEQEYLLFAQPDLLILAIQQVKLVFVEEVALRIEVVGS